MALLELFFPAVAGLITAIILIIIFFRIIRKSNRQFVYCQTCKKPLFAGDYVCRNCGADIAGQLPAQETLVPTEYAGQPLQFIPSTSPMQNQIPAEALNLSIAGMVCGIVSFFFGGWILGIVGLVLSLQGAKRTPAGVNNSYAKIGKICSIISIALFSILTLLIIW